MGVRNNWKLEELSELYDLPVLDLVFKAATVHREYHDSKQVQISSLVSIKTGGCPEDCSYCPQAARYDTDVNTHKLMQVDEVIDKAKKAKAAGSSRLCMGAAWREVRDNRDFDRVLDMVREVNAMDMEVCCTLGMLSDDQAQRLADAGLYAYNHNIDTSEEHYEEVISTRTFKDRIDTHKSVRKAGVSLCSGGIIGLGETKKDRLKMILALANSEKQPESVPINTLVPVEGTPLENQEKVPVWDLIKMVAIARITMPRSAVRLSAGRLELTDEGQAFCFMAGANSIFAGETLLTTPNPEFDNDMMLFKTLGLESKKAFADGAQPKSKTDTVVDPEKLAMEAKVKEWKKELAKN
ncbi:MAG: biotin synthase [Saprospiraceae bacterium]|jgi:biotin synthase